MRISADDVARIARLAEIEVTPDELPALVAQLDRIMDYVAQLTSYRSDAELPDFLPGPAGTPLRADVVAPVPLARTPEDLAPAWRDGCFVVPRLSAMNGGEA